MAQIDWQKLREALQRVVRDHVTDEEFRGDFPARAWAYINDVLHEARLSNQQSGAYHGFSLEYPEHFPEDKNDKLRSAPRVTVTVV